MTKLDKQFFTIYIAKILEICKIKFTTKYLILSYLPEPIPVPTDCCADCTSAIRDALPVGTTGVNIVTNTQITTQGNVIVNEPGMIVVENTERNSITFVSPCRIDVMYLPN